MAFPFLTPLATVCKSGAWHGAQIRRYGSSLTQVCQVTSRSQRPIPSLSRHSFVQAQCRNFHTTEPFQSPKFTYGVAASFTAKDRKYNPETNIFNFNPYNKVRSRRKDKKARPASGQDAFFVSRIGSTSDIAMGVADGVGGWADSGVDSADFAHGFCDYMAHAAYTHKPEEWDPPIGARSLMQRGYEDISKDRSVPAGGSTACVAIAKGNGTLEVANLGDSGFVQLRLNAIHNYSEPQTHAFNTPYQLSLIPERMLKQLAAFGGQQLADFPSDANISRHNLRHGDVLVFASDGVWDNLSSQDILKIVSKMMIGSRAWEHTEEGISVSKSLQNFILADDGKSGAEEIPALQAFLAVGITGEAKAASMNTKVDGPFAREVQKYYPHENWRGGKVDDICVVVAVRAATGFSIGRPDNHKEHSHPVYPVAFSPDGAFLASAFGDFAIILWTEEAEEALQPSLVQEFLRFARHDSALDAKIRTLGPGLLRMLESLKYPLLHAAAIALVKIRAGHMTSADAPWAYKLGYKAHEIEIDEDD